MDNEASQKIKQAIRKKGAGYQLVPPHQHHINAAKHAICTFKNHFIARLCSTDPNFPLYLWDHLLSQATLTLNLLRQARINSKLLVHAILEGPHDFNTVPLAPPGTRAVIFDDPHKRASWAPHGTDTWYVGPAPEHYQNFTFYVPATRSIRITDTADFFPVHTNVPNLSTADAATLAANNFIVVLHKPAPAAPFCSLTTKHHQALQQLAKIFNDVVTPTSDKTLTLKEPRVIHRKILVIPPPTQPILQKLSEPRVETTTPTITSFTTPFTKAHSATQPQCPQRYPTRTKPGPHIIPPHAPTQPPVPDPVIPLSSKICSLWAVDLARASPLESHSSASSGSSWSSNLTSNLAP